MDINTIRTTIEVLAFVSFLGICWWAYTPRRKAALDDVGRSVLED